MEFICANTLYMLVGPICSLLPLKYELNCRSASFTVKGLLSTNRTVNFVARNGVFQEDVINNLSTAL